MGKLDTLKKNRAALFDKVSKDFDNKGGFTKEEDDKRFWKLTLNKDGQGAAIIRFLPPIPENGDELPWVRLYKYGFKGPTGKWYIENALSTIGQKDPVGEYNSARWEEAQQMTGDAKKNAEEAVKNRKRRTEFISNIQVIKDPANPDNNGKVFLFRYGPQIHSMIEAKGKPETDELTGETPDAVHVYDAFNGSNLRLKAKKKDEKAKFPSYETSEFEATVGPLCDGDEDEMERVLDACYPLHPFIAPDQFKSYEDLQKQLNKALNLGDGASGSSSSAGSKPARTALEQLDDDTPTVPSEDKPVTKVTKVSKTKKAEPEPTLEVGGDNEDDDDPDFFKNLLND
jgi:hypothetical protein